MSYTVLIKEEHGVLVARDEAGDWRTKGEVANWQSMEPREVALQLFHACELGEVSKTENGIVAEIIE